jgi:hypothetical protein
MITVFLMLLGYGFINPHLIQFVDITRCAVWQPLCHLTSAFQLMHGWAEGAAVWSPLAALVCLIVCLTYGYIRLPEVRVR